MKASLIIKLCYQVRKNTFYGLGRQVVKCFSYKYEGLSLSLSNKVKMRRWRWMIPLGSQADSLALSWALFSEKLENDVWGCSLASDCCLQCIQFTQLFVQICTHLNIIRKWKGSFKFAFMLIVEYKEAMLKVMPFSSWKFGNK